MGPPIAPKRSVTYTAKARRTAAKVKTVTPKVKKTPSVAVAVPQAVASATTAIPPQPQPQPQAEHTTLVYENEGDELAVEAAGQNLECGRCGAVLGIAAGIASRKCSVSLFRPLPSESPELRPLLGYVVAYSLGNVVRANELLGVKHVLSVYDCTDCRIPSLSLTSYVERFTNFTTAPREVFVTAIAYIDRFLASNPRGIELALCNVHRIFAVSFVVASKFVSDLYNSNKYYARVAGVSLEELNTLERAFLNDLGYNLFLTPEQYDAYNRPAEFLSHIADMYGDLLAFLRTLVKSLRSNWLVKQTWTPPSFTVAAQTEQCEPIFDCSADPSSIRDQVDC